ncbi:MAG: hypothetical protein MH252_10930 [Thermosynechococcaceae cyanobacterium MS004]|nr:hypothetical protein [Thermosynechococcaceae cyanobacterium MS004]
MDQIQQNSSQKLNPSNLGKTSDPDSDELAQQKIEARVRLLAMPPEQAQRIVEQTLYPQLWECRVEEHLWEESIPTHYGETDP